MPLVVDEWIIEVYGRLSDLGMSTAVGAIVLYAMPLYAKLQFANASSVFVMADCALSFKRMMDQRTSRRWLEIALDSGALDETSRWETRNSFSIHLVTPTYSARRRKTKTMRDSDSDSDDGEGWFWDSFKTSVLMKQLFDDTYDMYEDADSGRVHIMFPLNSTDPPVKDDYQHHGPAHPFDPATVFDLEVQPNAASDKAHAATLPSIVHDDKLPIYSWTPQGTKPPNSQIRNPCSTITLHPNKQKSAYNVARILLRWLIPIQSSNQASRANRPTATHAAPHPNL